jgi:hypothetical protein
MGAVADQFGANLRGLRRGHAGREARTSPLVGSAARVRRVAVSLA